MVKVNFLCEKNQVMTIDPESNTESALTLMLVVCLIILLLALVVAQAPHLF
jgi:hypothetical protein